MPNVVPISQARANLPDLVDQAATLSKKTYISVKGKVKAVLMDPAEVESLEATIEVLSDKETMKAIKESQEDIKHGRVYPLEDVIKELGLDD